MSSIFKDRYTLPETMGLCAFGIALALFFMATVEVYYCWFVFP